MLDIHTHILPGIDDGPQDWELSLDMLRVAEKDGVKAVVATPHVAPGLFENKKAEVVALTDELRSRVTGINVKVYPGSELTVCSETLEGLSNGTLCTINSGRYALVELPGHFSTEKVLDFMYTLHQMKIVPIIAHPERNPKLMRDVNVVHDIFDTGALMQVTAVSLTGLFGSKVKKFSAELLTRKLVHFIASDTHNTGPRSPELSHGLKEAEKVIGPAAAKVLVVDNPIKVVNNEPIDADAAVFPPKKKFLFF